MTQQRSRLLTAALSLFVMSLPVLAHAAPDPVAKKLEADEQRVGVAAFTAPQYQKGTVRHVVLIRFKPGLPGAERKKITEEFLALQKSSLRDGKTYIESIETGPQISGEGASHELQQAFILTFASQGDRNYFIGTPIVTDPQHYEAAHAAFKDKLKPVLAKDGLVSFDFPVLQTAQ